jgi:lipopolysaccharide transport system ATP-binding protein
MCCEPAITVDRLSKCYQIYDQPRDRLLQMLARQRKRYYREFWALREVSFSIGRGETVGIIGRNGSGKSILLQMICGTVSPTQGLLSTHGRVAALLELGAGFNAEFTGRENAIINAAILGIGAERMQERMSQVLAFSELGDFLDQPVKTYSSGMHARLAFSIAIHTDPDILVIDEALAVGDARFVAKCMRKIRTLQEQGTTILFVSHDVGAVRTLCQRVIWLDQGRCVEDGPVFPVTGRFMEFMFQEDAPRDEAPGLHVHGKQKATESTLLVAQANADIDRRPVLHWGSRPGLIVAASVCNADGTRQDLHAWGEPLSIRLEVQLPPDLSREGLRLAFSIKDLKGTDLIVSSTAGELPETPGRLGHILVQFQMTNPLVSGKYLLVAAVERRNALDVHYYEYLEGAHYFASLSEQRFFGLFQPSIRVAVQAVEGVEAVA